MWGATNYSYVRHSPHDAIHPIALAAVTSSQMLRLRRNKYEHWRLVSAQAKT
jgi:hypothetical protein